MVADLSALALTDRGDAVALAAVGGLRGAGRGWRVRKVSLGPSGVRVLDRMPLIALEFGLEGQCCDPVSGKGRGPDALEKAQAHQAALDVIAERERREHEQREEEERRYAVSAAGVQLRRG